MGKWIIVRTTDNGEITKETVTIDETVLNDINHYHEMDDNFICAIPLEWIKEKQ